MIKGGEVLDNLEKIMIRGVLNNLVSNDLRRGWGTGQPGENGE